MNSLNWGGFFFFLITKLSAYTSNFFIYTYLYSKYSTLNRNIWFIYHIDKNLEVMNKETLKLLPHQIYFYETCHMMHQIFLIFFNADKKKIIF